MSRDRRREPDRIVYGLGPIEELIRRRPASITRLELRRGGGKRLTEVADAARAAGVAVAEVEEPALDAAAGPAATHQGAVARVGAYPYADLDDLIAGARDPGLILILDGVTDPRNLGAICRTAYLLGADGIVVGKDRAAPINAAATKAAAGATELLSIAQVTNLARALEELREAGWWRAQIAATSEARPLDEIDASSSLALVLGSEGRGVRPLVARHTDFAFAIPMSGRGIGSLNVAVAASVALYEIARQRRGARS